MSNLKYCLTVEDFDRWLLEAVRGDRCVYYEGLSLAGARDKFILTLDKELQIVRTPISDLADFVYEAYLAGDVWLVQRRIGPRSSGYQYIAEKK